MIIGIGTDIVSVARLGEALGRNGDRFVERLLSESERAELPGDPLLRTRFMARRWAAKEAFAKAMGTGIRGEVALNAIIVCHDDLGRPYLKFSPALQEKIDARHCGVHLSISDERDYATAFVVIETLS